MCDRCGGSGEVAVSVYYPMSYVGAGPVPEDARGVVGRVCDECGGRAMLPRLTKCVVQRDELGGSYDRECAWLATPDGYDLDVPSGHGATPLAAVASLLWDMDLEDAVRVEDVEIVWE